MTKLNHENIDKVIAEISNEQNFFNMGEYYASVLHTHQDLENYNTAVNDEEVGCGTAACICGWANQIRLGEREDNTIYSFEQLKCIGSAGNWLGLEQDVRHDLFHVSHYAQRKRNNSSLAADHTLPHMRYITRSHAIAVLENLKETGVANWSEKI